MSDSQVTSEEKRQEAIKSFKYLWKTENSEWLTQRKKEWSHLSKAAFNGSSAKEKKTNKQYFIFGEKTDPYIPPLTLLFLTPYDSEESLKEVFFSDIFGPQDKKKIYSSYSSKAAKYGEGVSWRKEHIKVFVDTIQGESYKEISVKRHGRDYLVSPEPDSWAENFYIQSKKIMTEKISYDGCLETSSLNYFISALPHVTKPNIRQYINFKKIFDLANETLEDTRSSSTAKDMAKKLTARKQDILDAWAVNAHLDE